MLRVVTLNIWNLSGGWRERRQAILAVLRAAEPDVVCLQEVVANDHGNQAEWLAAELGGTRLGNGSSWSVAYAGATLPNAPGAPGAAATDDRFGNAVLSRWPIDDTAHVELPHVPDDHEIQRVAVHARTGGVDVFSTHLAWQLHDAALRERQVRALMRFVTEHTGTGSAADPAATIGPVVAGDFNAEPDATAIRYLTGLTALDGESTYLQDAWRLAGSPSGSAGLTWSNANPHAAGDQEPDRRIDYVFSGFHGRSGVGRPVECRVIADEPVDGVWPSDHFGVLAVLRTTPSPG